MLAAHVSGARYFHYRRNELGSGKDIAAKARAAAGAPSEDEPLEALDAACAGLYDLSQLPRE